MVVILEDALKELFVVFLVFEALRLTFEQIVLFLVLMVKGFKFLAQIAAALNLIVHFVQAMLQCLRVLKAPDEPTGELPVSFGTIRPQRKAALHMKNCPLLV